VADHFGGVMLEDERETSGVKLLLGVLDDGKGESNDDVDVDGRERGVERG
jgi:hypothetical protein